MEQGSADEAASLLWDSARKREPWATFLGASYFRAVGEQGQVGMSARGLALNVASSMPEEFPDFGSRRTTGRRIA